MAGTNEITADYEAVNDITQEQTAVIKMAALLLVTLMCMYPAVPLRQE